MRHESERVPGKNYRPLAGRPLYSHIVATLLATSGVDEVVIDTDSNTIMDDATERFPSVRVVRRPEHLRAGAIAMNDVLLNSIGQLEADVVLQTHSTNPFLRSATIEEALAAFTAARDHHDSAFGVTRLQARLWNATGRPLNHDPAVLLRTQDLEPVYLENSCFYIFAPDTLRKLGNRVGMHPLMVEVPALEAHDIDEESDFAVAEAMHAAGVV
jgi:CMP-N-acetylneuraminic acid synthetase